MSVVWFDFKFKNNYFFQVPIKIVKDVKCLFLFQIQKRERRNEIQKLIETKKSEKYSELKKEKSEKADSAKRSVSCPDVFKIAAKIDFWLKMEVGPQGSESDEVSTL